MHSHTSFSLIHLHDEHRVLQVKGKHLRRRAEVLPMPQEPM